jgi:DNA-binding response OmpR family regulator
MKKILVVDDQANIRTVMKYALREDFLIEEAHDAESALKMINANKPDAIVLDVMMPGEINGFQLCERIKKDALLRKIHVVLVTACGQVEDQELGAALGADAYFIKPFSPIALHRHLTIALMRGGK